MVHIHWGHLVFGYIIASPSHLVLLRDSFGRMCSLLRCPSESRNAVHTGPIIGMAENKLRTRDVLGLV